MHLCSEELHTPSMARTHRSSAKLIGTPAILFHRLFGVKRRLSNRVGVVVLLVDIASLVCAIHGGAVHAAIVLLLLHAAAHNLLRAWAIDHDTRLVGLCARIAILHGARLICLCL